MASREYAPHDVVENDVAERNKMLAALPNDVKQRVFPSLDLVFLRLGEVLYEPGCEVEHVFFPIDAIVSLLYSAEDGSSCELSVVGNEGMAGIALFMGGGSSTSRAVVQSAGLALRVPARDIKREFLEPGALHELLMHYMQSLFTQMAQTAFCNRHHSIDQQLCRWLLISLDRLPSNSLTMTQELIANMLGVRREGVTVAAGKLQRLGIIEYRRGKITVLDRPALERLCCECYAVVRREHDRLMPYAHTPMETPGLAAATYRGRGKPAGRMVHASSLS